MTDWPQDSPSVQPQGTIQPARPKPASLLTGQTLPFPAAQIGIVWSPKCACTKVVLWYFKMLGLLDEAMAYDAWPHRYRIKVFYRSQQYQRWLGRPDWRHFTWYQFARDPVKRLLSSLRHNLGYGHADDRISAALGREISCAEGYSLNDFLDYLETQNLSGKADPHVKLQRKRLSNVVDTHIVNIDELNMLDQMNAIERKHGLPLTDFGELSAFAADDRRRVNLNMPVEFSPDRVLTQNDAKGLWPVDASLLDATTIARIKRLYAPDVRFICDKADDGQPAGTIGIYRKASRALA
jgi:hypothetical protein